MNFKKTAMDFSNKDLNDFPPEIFCQKRLYKLNMSGNNITELPRKIEELRYLEMLNLSGNKIRHLYSKLFNLRNLKILILNDNEIVTVPKQILNLQKLKILGLANNTISKLPLEISKLKSLEELSISRNQISSLEMKGKPFANLKKIWLADNPMEKLDVNCLVSALPKLQSIYCFSSKVSNRVSESQPLLRKASAIRGNCYEFLKKMSEFRNDAIQKTPVIESYMSNQPLKKVNIFISYAHLPDQKKYLDRLMVHLKGLNFEMQLSVWSDSSLRTGDNFHEEIKVAIEEANAAILLISTDFLASDYIRNNELPPLLKAANQKGTKIYPILVHPSRFLKINELKDFYAVNDVSETLSECSFPTQERIFLKLMDDISSHFNETKI